jgi:chitinase
MRTPSRIALAALTALALVVPAAAPAMAATDPAAGGRVVVYYQKHFETETPSAPLAGYISPLPLLTQNTGVTAVNLGAIHIDPANGTDPVALTINLVDPANPGYAPMWADLQTMQDAGIQLIGMLGGAANFTWITLRDDYATAYPLLRDFVQTYGLDGLDLDIETMEDSPRTGPGFPTDPALVVQLVQDLRADFGDDFLVTMAPIAPALAGDEVNLSGFDYDELYAQIGDDIAWFNGQFYCGHAFATPEYYQDIVNYQAQGGGIPTSKIVMIALTNPDNCGGWVPIDELAAGVTALAREYADFGGVAGWEYFNSLPGGPAEPWRWAAEMRAAINAAAIPIPTPTPTPSPTAPAVLPATGPTDPTPSLLLGAAALLAIALGSGALVRARRARG